MSGAPNLEHEASLVCTIEAWRAQGADRFEPVRFRLIQTLARRAQACQGAARALLEHKVALLLATHAKAFEQAQAAVQAKPPGSPARGPLAGLLAHIAQQSASAPAQPAGGPAELKAVQQFRSTWTKLSAEQRLTQALATVPENAGPLNSQRLVHRSLALMRELSPDYLERFVSYVDALMWLDNINGSSSPPLSPSKTVARTDAARQRARSKAS